MHGRKDGMQLSTERNLEGVTGQLQNKEYFQIFFKRNIIMIMRLFHYVNITILNIYVPNKEFENA